MYDNSKTNLVYETEEYDFPKFKNNVPESIELLINDGIKDYIAFIMKQEDKSYILSCDIGNINESDISLIIKSIDGDNNIYKNYSIISQFFNFNELYDLEESEINVNNNTKIKFILNNSDIPFISLEIINKPLESNIFLRLKNRELRNQDRYLFALSEAFMGSQRVIDNYILEFVQDNNTVKLSGSYTLKEGAGTQIIFYNPIVENYFNIKSEPTNTTGIISSNGKEIKYTMAKGNKNDADVYLLFLNYQDESVLSAGDTITFNLTPDKNYILDKVLKPVENVQELGEGLVLRYMIPPYYVQYPDTNGNFNPNEEPSNWYSKMYGVTTTWQIMFNTESVYFRTEGDLANAGRSNGLQGDAGRNATGKLGATINGDNSVGIHRYYQQGGTTLAPGSYAGWVYVDSNLSRAYTTANEFRTRNRLIRVYKLLSINGVSVEEILQGA